MNRKEKRECECGVTPHFFTFLALCSGVVQLAGRQPLKLDTRGSSPRAGANLLDAYREGSGVVDIARPARVS